MKIKRIKNNTYNLEWSTSLGEDGETSYSEGFFILEKENLIRVTILVFKLFI